MKTVDEVADPAVEVVEEMARRLGAPDETHRQLIGEAQAARAQVAFRQ